MSTRENIRLIARTPLVTAELPMILVYLFDCFGNNVELIVLIRRLTTTITGRNV